MRYREIIEVTSRKPSGIIKPKKPLSPEQARARSQRQQRIQHQIKDEKTRSANKLRDLQTKLTT